MNEVKNKYRDLARVALFHHLYDYQFQDDISLKVEKTEIVKAFNYSETILKRRCSDEESLMLAEAVFENCILLVICLFFPMDARTVSIRDAEYSITAERQLEVLRQNLKRLEALES